LASLRANRSSEVVSALLSRLEVEAKGKNNLMPLFIECVENEVTLGEICKVLRNIWGEYQAPMFI